MKTDMEKNREILRRIQEGPPNSEYRSGSICWANVTLKSKRCVKHGLVKHLELICLDGVNGGVICLRCAIDLTSQLGYIKLEEIRK